MFPIYFRLRCFIISFQIFEKKKFILNEENVSKRLVVEVVDFTKTIWRRVSIDF